ncbi:hypothetical protein J4405_00745 [Candidatus Woesearchaeota archaeon]|nr:hypothetical protein [Candidatus Woesearchaeota archaeon]
MRDNENPQLILGEKIVLIGILTDLKRDPLINLGGAFHYLFDEWFGSIDTSLRRYYLTGTIKKTNLEDRELNIALTYASRIRIEGVGGRLQHEGLRDELGTDDILSQIFPVYKLTRDPEGLVVMVTDVRRYSEVKD